MTMQYKVGDRIRGRYLGLDFVGTISNWHWHSYSPEVCVTIELPEPLDVHPGKGLEPYESLHIQYGANPDPMFCLLGMA